MFPAVALQLRPPGTKLSRTRPSSPREEASLQRDLRLP